MAAKLAIHLVDTGSAPATNFGEAVGLKMLTGRDSGGGGCRVIWTLVVGGTYWVGSHDPVDLYQNTPDPGLPDPLICWPETCRKGGGG